MVVIPDAVVAGYGCGVSVGVLAQRLGYTRVQVRGWYRVLGHRGVRDRERVAASAARDRAAFLVQAGVKRALRDDDPAGCSTDYPLDGLRRWGVGGVPSCFGIARD